MAQGGGKTLGINTAQHNTSTQKYGLTLGSRWIEEDGTEYTYVKAGAAIAAGDAVKIDTSDTTNLPFTVIKTSAATSKMVGVAESAFTSGYYGWIVTKGRVEANVATSVAAGDGLIPTSTAGRLGTYANTDVVNIGAYGLEAEASNLADVYVLGVF